MSAGHSVAFLVDVDDTLIDNDGIRDDLQEHVGSTYGAESGERYWTIQERRFVELGYRDYLGAAQEWWEGEGSDPRLLDLSRYLLDYPFADRLYPDALRVPHTFAARVGRHRHGRGRGLPAVEGSPCGDSRSGRG